MSAPARILSLILGSQRIVLAEFFAQPSGGLVLQNYRFCEVLVDPADEEIDQAELASLCELVDELHVKGREVNYAVTAQSVFARFVKLPSVEHEKIERIIAFEAQQNLPVT